MKAESTWATFFKEAGISKEYAAIYAKYFVENQITFLMLSKLEFGDSITLMKKLGITILGHCVNIFEHSKNLKSKYHKFDRKNSVFHAPY